MSTSQSSFADRSSGILLHPTSLPGPHGIGDLGPGAYRFADFLAQANQRWWQMLPVSPIGGGNSPYDSPSSFAGSPLLISLERLAADGLLEAHDLAAPLRFDFGTRAHYPAARRFREKRLRKAFANFEAQARPDARAELASFIEHNRFWLPDYALFCALKRSFSERPWTQWDPELKKREPHALERARRELDTEIRYQEFLQHQFQRQWVALRTHCKQLGIALLGDVPMFAAHDGSDVWANQQFFQLDDNGQCLAVAGVPPDYFSADGQRWGNPLYDWNALKAHGYKWWISRLQTTLERFEAVRLDHFIGFHRYWSIPAHADSAKHGHFVEVPGEDFFGKLRDALGSLPFIAEDLGIVTPEVQRLRDNFDLPGMRVLAFGFGDTWSDYQPHRFPRRTVVYTGTHDNDTLVGWLNAADRARDPWERERLRKERERALRYVGSQGHEPHWDLIRGALSSVADTALFPLQDLLGLGTEARMNVPGVADGNWTWRTQASALSPELAERMAALCETYERIPASRRRA